MLIRKFDRNQLESEPHNVLFKDLYPWDAIQDTPFGASLAVVEPGGKTMIHHHNPCETFLICQGRGTMTCNGESSQVSSGDVIYLPPQSEHFLANDSATDSLMFLSVFWDSPEEAEFVAVGPTLYVPSPPTPNGGLHLGHLSGPYLLADVLKRFDRQCGRTAGWMLISDDHQSYTALRAHFDKTPAAQTATSYTAEIMDLLKSMDATPEAIVQPSQNPDYRRAVLEVPASLKLEAVEREGWHCAHCQLFLYDGYARGYVRSVRVLAGDFYAKHAACPIAGRAWETCTVCCATALPSAAGSAASCFPWNLIARLWLSITSNWDCALECELWVESLCSCSNWRSWPFIPGTGD
ncbi:MAG: cupin domain-containing protein [Vulcanimicrobiota bacterium]